MTESTAGEGWYSELKGQWEGGGTGGLLIVLLRFFLSYNEVEEQKRAVCGVKWKVGCHCIHNQESCMCAKSIKTRKSIARMATVHLQS